VQEFLKDCNYQSPYNTRNAIFLNPKNKNGTYISIKWALKNENVKV
jgi:hypothetical protein